MRFCSRKTKLVLGRIKKEMPFEFVNRPEFVDFARQTIKKLRGRAVAEETINAFVHLFREKYTYERD